MFAVPNRCNMTESVTLTVRGTNRFDRAVEAASGAGLRAASLRVIQVNIGLKCNLACRHCHVESGPKRTEAMTRETLELILKAAEASEAETIDITGGAPEMHPDFRWFVRRARAQGHEVIARTNLTIMLEDGYGDLPEFYRDHRVHLVASLPCYLQTNVDKQRGRHVYEDSVEVIRRLNSVGYAVEHDLPLDLVYNPLGGSLPPPQESLEADYRRELDRQFGLRFTRLYTITNMPIGRFLHDLERSDKAQAYHELLRNSFNPATVDGLMCRHQIHVCHDGTLSDCDFNYALKMGTAGDAPRHIKDFSVEALRDRVISTGEHCFACTAGCGSSCGGSLA